MAGECILVLCPAAGEADNAGAVEVLGWDGPVDRPLASDNRGGVAGLRVPILPVGGYVPRP